MAETYRSTVALNTQRRMSLVFALLCVASALFAALGVWQLERRTQKLALIRAVDMRVHQPATAAPGPQLWPFVSFRTAAYRHVRVGGRYVAEHEILVQAVTEFGPGFWVMTPLRTDVGWTVLVNRGFVSADRAKRTVPRGRVVVTGLLRLSEPGGGFLHSNDPSRNRWYSRDVPAIGKAQYLSGLAPYFIDAEAGHQLPGQPVGGLTAIAFANNHLQYAITWFALAALSLFGAVRAWRSRASSAS